MPGGGSSEGQKSWLPGKQSCSLSLNAVLPLTFLCSRPPVSRAAPQPEKLQKNNITKKKKLVEVRRLNYCASNLILVFKIWQTSLSTCPTL
jgi:hypothetical protein